MPFFAGECHSVGEFLYVYVLRLTGPHWMQSLRRGHVTWANFQEVGLELSQFCFWGQKWSIIFKSIVAGSSSIFNHSPPLSAFWVEADWHSTLKYLKQMNRRAGEDKLQNKWSMYCSNFSKGEKTHKPALMWWTLLKNHSSWMLPYSIKRLQVLYCEDANIFESEAEQENEAIALLYLYDVTMRHWLFSTLPRFLYVFA